MKIKVSELEGAELDYWVAKANGLDNPILHRAGKTPNGGEVYTEHVSTKGSLYYMPSSDWSQGGPIIERERIRFGDDYDHKATNWVVSAYIGMGKSSCGDSVLVAAMRCYVASKFGEEVGREG